MWQNVPGDVYKRQHLYGGAVPTYYDISNMWTGPGDTNATLPKFEYGSVASLQPVSYTHLITILPEIMQSISVIFQLIYVIGMVKPDTLMVYTLILIQIQTPVSYTHLRYETDKYP